jgi:hypothetical protein
MRGYCKNTGIAALINRLIRVTADSKILVEV